MPHYAEALSTMPGTSSRMVNKAVPD